MRSSPYPHKVSVLNKQAALFFLVDAVVVFFTAVVDFAAGFLLVTGFFTLEVEAFFTQVTIDLRTNK